MTAVPEPTIQVIEGQRTLVIVNEHGLPKGLDELLRQMTTFGFTVKLDIVPAGARPSCEALREHRFVEFRRGRWWSHRPLTIQAGPELDTTRIIAGRIERVTNRRVLPAGLFHLSLLICRDCGAVCVRDVTPEAGSSPVHLVNRMTGARRVQLPPRQRDIVLGWYSGKRRAGREYL